MTALTATILARPYVFLFLLAYLFLAWRLWGWRRTMLWLVSGYLIAWASEYSSIHNGFPYGEYHYIYENMPGELMVAGIPFFDTLSYPFLIFAGFTMARERIFLGALLTMLLDVIIDPLATMGDKWFLGQIHWYAYPGWYFGVPLTNFMGWFLVPLSVIGFNIFMWRFWCHPEQSEGSRGILRSAQNDKLNWLYPAFYLSIALFNITISFWIGEWRLGLASLIVTSLTIYLLLFLRKRG